MSRPPTRRGSQGERPQASKTSRPASASSSAIWQPDCPLPMTSTFPACGISFQVRDQLVARHEAVGIIAVIGLAGKLEGPVGQDQTEAVPTIPPGLGDPVPLHDHMLHSTAGQLM